MNKKILAALILNIFVVVCTAIITTSYYFYCNNPLVETGFDSYKFFTTDSNILAGLTALVMIPFEIQILRGKRKKLPHFAEVLKYIGMTSVMLTFLTVMILLLPLYDIKYLLLGTAFYMHVAGPLAMLVTFIFLETDSKIKLSESFLTLLPCVLYGAVYFIEVVIIGEANGGWMDFYTFNRGGFWYITAIVVLGVVFLIATVTRLIHNKMVKVNSDERSETDDKKS